MKQSSILVIVLSLFLAMGLEANVTKAKKKELKRQALAKKPKPMFLMKKATEDLDVEEPKQDILQRQYSTVGSDERFFSMD